MLSLRRTLDSAVLPGDIQELLSFNQESPSGDSEVEMRHELLFKTSVLPGESKDSIAAMFDRHVMQFNPKSNAEYELIEQLTSTCWRMRRFWALETSMIADHMAGQTSGDMLSRVDASLTLLAEMPKFNLIGRHEARLDRIYQRALRTLLHLQRS